MHLRQIEDPIKESDSERTMCFDTQHRPYKVRSVSSVTIHKHDPIYEIRRPAKSACRAEARAGKGKKVASFSSGSERRRGGERVKKARPRVRESKKLDQGGERGFEAKPKKGSHHSGLCSGVQCAMYDVHHSLHSQIHFHLSLH